MRGTVSDNEIDRKLNSLVFAGVKHARVDGRVDIELRNNKGDSFDVEISLRFGGRADQATAEGKIRLNSFRESDWTVYHGDRAVNNSSLVR